MFRIDDASAAVAMPTPETAGTPGYFTEGNPAGGVAATLIRASWLNAVQEELMSLLGAAGIAPSKTTFNQLLTAIRAIGAAQFVATDAGANFTLQLPNGWIVQGGSASASTGGFNNVFPSAFPTKIFGVLLGNQDANPITTYVGVSSVTLTGFTLTANTGSTRSVYWLAVGK